MQSFTYTALLGIPLGGFKLRALGSHVLWPNFPDRYARFPPPISEVPQPQGNKFPWFGLFRFRSPLLTESFHFLFLGLLRCFTSPRFASLAYEFNQ